MKRSGVGRFESSDNSKRARVDSDRNVASKVLFINSLPPDVSEGEVVQLGLPFGRMTAMILNKKKNQAFLEMDDLDVAQTMVNYYTEHPPKISQRTVHIRFSNYDHLKMEANAQNAGCIAALKAADQLLEGLEEPKATLRIIIDNMLYPITIEILHKIFSKFGQILRIVTFNKNNQFHAFIEFGNPIVATAAKNSLNGQNIYNGCCTLRIDYSKLDKLTVKYNNEKMWDFTNPNLSSGDGGNMGGDGMMGSMQGMVGSGGICGTGDFDGSRRRQSGGRNFDYDNDFYDNTGVDSNSRMSRYGSGSGNMNSMSGNMSGIAGNMSGISQNLGGMGQGMGQGIVQGLGGLAQHMGGNMGGMAGNMALMNNLAGNMGGMSGNMAGSSGMAGNMGLMAGQMGGNMGGMFGNLGGMSNAMSLAGGMGNIVSMAGNVGSNMNRLGANMGSSSGIPSLLGNIPGLMSNMNALGNGNLSGVSGNMGGELMAAMASGMGGYGGMLSNVGHMMGGGMMNNMGRKMVGSGMMGGNGDMDRGHNRGNQSGIREKSSRIGRKEDIRGDFGGNGGTCVVLASNLNEERITPDNIFTLFGVYGDVVRVKILFNKKDSALVEYSGSEQAQFAVNNLNHAKWWGKEIRVSRSKHQHIMEPKEGVPEAWLTKDFSNSNLHRFKNPHSKNYNNIYPPTATLHLSNIPTDTTEDMLTDMFGEYGRVVAFKFFQKDKKMGFIQMASAEEAISALIELHNHELGPRSHLRVSFTQSTIKD